MVKRRKNQQLAIPILYGSLSKPLINTTTQNTHSWSLYLKSPEGRKLQPLIHHVVFTLHPSFAQPTRKIETEPFLVEEQGWGEFEAEIEIVLNDISKERPVKLKHFIKLFSGEVSSSETAESKVSSSEITSEKYDELVLQDPTEEIWDLFHGMYLTQPLVPHPQYNQQTEQKEVLAYQKAMTDLDQKMKQQKTFIQQSTNHSYNKNTIS